MPLPKNRSKKYRKMTRKTTNGSKPVFQRRKSFSASCALCKRKLAGVRPGSRTEKSVSRKFGGHLCQACCERIIKEAVRVKEGEKSLDAVNFDEKKYVQPLLRK